MSVVGPRPIVEEEIWRYGPFFADYCSVRPGLTGLWQVSGRNNVTYERRVMLDCEYARRKSLRFDFEIIMRTFAVVAFARGAY
jgi:lipopolysaccharide/colanic/teichoic acid biosynthesis glycosyltransferase